MTRIRSSLLTLVAVPRRREAGAAVRVAVLTALIAGVVPVTPAAAQFGWSATPATLSAGGQDVGRPKIAFSPAGDGVAVWLVKRSDTSYVVQASRYTASSGTWRAPADLSAPDVRSFGPRVGIDANGDAWVTWLRYDGALYFVEAARSAAATGTWAAASDIGGGGFLTLPPALAVSASGDAIAVWSRLVNDSFSVHGARYSAAAGVWSPVLDLSNAGQQALLADVAIDSAGNAVAAWTWNDGTDELIQSTRYAVGGGTWSTPVTISTGPGYAAYAGVALDDLGNAVVVWDKGGLETARYDAMLAAWSPVVRLSDGVWEQDTMAVAIDQAGNAFTAWTNAGVVRAARYQAAAGAWSISAPLSAVTLHGGYPRVSVDPAGNATVAWTWTNAVGWVTQAARYIAATGAWTTAATLSQLSLVETYAEVAMDARGNALALWLQHATAAGTIQGTWWHATPAAPAIPFVSVAGGLLQVAITPPVTPEVAFAPLTYEYSTDDGVTWTARQPASTASPLEIAGLVSGIPYRLRLRAVNTAGTGQPSPVATATPGPAPGPPESFAVAAQSGRSVTFTWLPPANSVAPASYVLEGGVQPGQTMASVALGPNPVLTTTAPAGVFYLRLYAVAGPYRSVASNEIRVVIDVPVPPSAPADLLGLVDGATLGLSWTNTFTGGEPTALWIQVTGDVTGTAPIPVGETFALAGVPAGTYTLQLVAVNASGASAPSNPVTLTFPAACTGAPAPPLGFTASVSGATVTAAWRPPAAGPALTHYVLSVTGSYVGAVATPLRMVSGALPPGTYTFQVAAANPCGTSLPAPAQTVTVP